MKRWIILSALVVIAVVLNSCSGEGEASEAGASTISAKTTPVKVMKLAPASFANYLQITGTVEARNHVKIMVEEGGTLLKVLKDKGSYAKAGETLAVLENNIIKAQYEQAEAALRQAELDHKSKNVLYEKRAISENEYLNAAYTMQSAQAAYNLAKARYDKLFIKAPLNGLVNDRYYDLGAYANPMSPMFEFIDNEVMRVRAGVAERFMSDIKVGTPVEVSFDAYPEMKIDAKVTFVSRSIEANNRTFTVEVTMQNKERKLAPAMIANLRILRESHENQIVVPLDALVESEKGWYVFVKDGAVAKRVAVQQEAINQNNVMVNGLKSGQQLIYVGHRELTDGDSIEVIN
ncbi:MAG: efflux RND transporter periplasmic adaptor subunit [Calditrichia bacterium]|nr:efflux RND transporter periplasmic adaptor subunit [Calditrichota bacterium]MCB9066657.1 efflux RND transporter periplasmic adaptor subunit [Calditrichia bacterium]